MTKNYLLTAKFPEGKWLEHDNICKFLWINYLKHLDMALGNPLNVFEVGKKKRLEVSFTIMQKNM